MDWDAIKKIDLQRFDAIWQEARADMLFEAWLQSRDLTEWARYLADNPPSPATLAIALMLGREKYESTKGRNAANTKHRAPGGSHDMRAEIQKVFASGKYGNNRDKCAQGECDRLGISLSTARKNLRNTPNPA